MKQFLSDMPVLGLFNYREFLFQHLKVLVAVIFPGSKVFCFTNVESVRNFCSSYFSKRNVTRNSARVQNYSKLFVVLEINLKCFPSSKFEPRSFAKCLQNLLIEKKIISGKSLAIF